MYIHIIAIIGSFFTNITDKDVDTLGNTLIEKGSYVHTLTLDDQKYISGEGIKNLAKYLESTYLTKLSLKGKQHLF